MRKDKIIYSICIGDIQKVARGLYTRELTDRELEKVGNHIGDLIDWSDLIESAINDEVEIEYKDVDELNFDFC